MASLWIWSFGFAFLLAAVLLFLVKSASFYRRYKYMRKIPTDWPQYWILGQLPLFDPGEETNLKWFHDHITKARYKIHIAWFSFFYPILVVVHPDPLKKILKEPKAEIEYGLLKPWLGNGLLIANGQQWAKNRRLLTPAFHFGILRHYGPIFNSCAKELISKWSVAAEKGKTVDVFDDIRLLTLDVMLQTAFSFKSNCQRTKSPYIKSVELLSKLTIARMLNPILTFDVIFYLTPMGWNYSRSLKVVHHHTEEIIQQRRKVLKESVVRESFSKGKKHLDFLDILLTTKDENGLGLSDDEIRSEVDTFLFEGHDTTASGISWTLYCLAKHSEHQAKCREEIMQVLNGRDELEWDDLKSLEYTTMCIKEAMRLYPPVDKIYRDAKSDMVVEGYFIPKGSNLSIWILGLHRHPDFWENPEVYDPLRFTPQNCAKRDPFVYIPFSAGQRNCIGQVFALNEERAMIAAILKEFDLSLDVFVKVEFMTEVTLRAVNGISLHVTKLN